MENSFIPYGRQWIDEDDISEVVKSLNSDLLTQGPKVEEFEKAVAEYTGAEYGVAVSSGTAALELAYKVIGISDSDEIITSPLTFSATSNAFVNLGARPVFIDIEKDTLNIDPKEIENKITKKTKAVAVIDFAGHPCDFDEIKKIAKRHNLLIVEDASHAIGSSYKDKRIGSLSDLTVFSFHPVKNITTGEGGMVLTNNKELYEKLKVLRHHKIVKIPEKGGWCYDIEEPSSNFRISDFQCALGLSQLKKIDKFIQRRRDIAGRYNEAFKDIKNISLPREKEYAKSAWHLYIIQINSGRTKELFESFKEQGIGVQVHYIPVHLLSFYQKRFGFREGDFPIAENYYRKALTLPLFPKMTDYEVERVIKTVKKLL
ncbi:MAG: UDP-4-amino-4,6-dideoxy-N-acetyl-beta-L-altrosamine transaminase [Candidatus Pacebacteria bacterium]|nr:UDP-4-amino-4,6-dideoxy-N-acetyl-beta-L-altrosamine transaminase [Candidatus Paceibacterota bacterium]